MKAQACKDQEPVPIRRVLCRGKSDTAILDYQLPQSALICLNLGLSYVKDRSACGNKHSGVT